MRAVWWSWGIGLVVAACTVDVAEECATSGDCPAGAACTFGTCGPVAPDAGRDGAAPGDGAVPAGDGAAPGDGSVPADGAAPGDGSVPADGAAPRDGSVPADGAAPADARIGADGAAPADGAPPDAGIDLDVGADAAPGVARWDEATWDDLRWE